MFTGIIEETGTISATRVTGTGKRLIVDARAVCVDAAHGSSIAVDGVCLTVAATSGSRIDFDVIPETLRRSTLGGLRVGDRVNLERSLAAGARIDGHFVQGHIDATAELIRRETAASEHVLWFRVPDAVRSYLIPKGSIALAGVSLTIAAIEGDAFSVALIPTTLERTTLGGLRPGDLVNVESDILTRTVVHRLAEMAGSSGGVSASLLRGHGFQ